MDSQDIRTLQLLEEMEKDRATSQRDLARKLNVSLGLVNSFIKRLASKGYFKVTTIPKNRVRYILTPKGAAQKSLLTYQYIQYSYRFYRSARQELHNLFSRLEGRAVRSIVFLGAGDLAEIAFISLQQSNIQLAAIVDEARAGERFLGYRVALPAELQDTSYDLILVTATGKKAVEIRRSLPKDIPTEKVIFLHEGLAGTYPS
jgi:DNA-binding MarR family transcriptional regulator